MTGHTISTPLLELTIRIEKLQKSLATKGIDGALVAQKTDLFYFSGTAQQGWLYIPAEGEQVLMVFKDYERACLESPFDNIVSIVSPKRIVESIKDAGLPLPKVLGMEFDVLPVNLYHQYLSIFEGVSIVDISTEIRLIRAVKSDYEIDLIKSAAELSDSLATKVQEFIAPGKTEIEVAGRLEGYARSLGHQGIVRMRMWGNELFYGHLIAGDNGAVPSYLASPTGGKGVSTPIAQGAGFRKIRKNEPIVVDYVFALNGYLSDNTRIYTIGSLPDELLAAHDVMLEVQELVQLKAKPGVETGELYEFMVSVVEGKGYGDNFMGVGDRRIRFTGHGVGLELDEFPFIAKGQKLKLQAGMVIALEPKLIFPGVGVVGIENTHLVTDDGLKKFMKYPDQITILPE